MSKWQCINNCGACCNLTPEDRPDLAKYLSSEELELYMSMVGEDGWCINYDHYTRKCHIYQDRPRFCRVQPDSFEDMYGVEATEFNEFAIACCQQQISGVYGRDSDELERYNKSVNSTLIE
ncbi:YkgJ family cysteine cluster protein [Pleurocapsa sp. PCC 7319]|uniref:YkgJ family cysteine cluster protein n=1 Tax=Pleurocapsa sp. PCC 7319 TaxID=118161 RepID=UPI0004768092